MLALCRNFTHNLHGAFAVKTVQVVRIFKNENHQKSMTMESQSADSNMSPEVEKGCDVMDDQNRVLAKVGDSKSRKLVNIEAFFEETKRQMTDVLKKSTTERDKTKNELKQLQEDNRRCRNEVEACERRSRDKCPVEVISDSDIEEIERIAFMVPKVLEDLQKDKEGFVTNLAAIDTATKMVDKINGEYKSKLQYQRKQLKVATEIETSKKAKIEKIQREIKKMKAEVERKKAELKEKERENSRLENSAEDVEKKVEALEAKRNEHRRQSKQIDKDFKLARVEYKMVMSERQNEIDYVKKQLADLQVKTDAQILPKKKTPGLFGYRRQLSRIFRRH